MKVHLLPSTIDENGKASDRQHLLSLIIDDRVAVDAGSLAFSCTDRQREQVRDILLTHTHLDHLAGLPLFIDDLFSSLEEPIRIYATSTMIEILERNIFNWEIYPRFSELANRNGPVIEYREFIGGSKFDVKHLSVQSVYVNHKVAAVGYLLSDNVSTIAISGDTAETDGFWTFCNTAPNLRAVLIECAFPDEMGELATDSNHLTPRRLQSELHKLENSDVPVLVINIKPMYRDKVISQIEQAKMPQVEIMALGKSYEF